MNELLKLLNYNINMNNDKSSLYKYLIIEIEERAKIYFGNKNWKEKLRKAVNIPKEESNKFFISKDPSLRLYCLFIDYLNKNAGSL